MSPPGIGVVVTTFRTGAMVEQTVASLLGQSLAPRRVVVVDDASPDAETLAALERVAALPTVTVLRQPVNGGVSAARNRGIDALDTDLVTFIDGDDLFEVSALAEFAAALDDAPSAAFAYPSVAAFGNRADLFEAPEYNLYALHMVNICPIASTVRREVFDAGLRFADGVNPEDWDFWLRLGEAGFLGTSAPRAVLHWRRWGFTRLTAATDRVGGLAGGVRAARPALFAPERLDALKRDWAPALSILAGDADELSLDGQVTRDAQIVPADAPGRVHGRHVLVAPTAAGLMADETLVDTLATVLDARPGLDAMVLVGERGLCRPLPLGTVLTDDALGDLGIDARSVAAVVLRRTCAWARTLAGDTLTWAQLVDAVVRHGARDPGAAAALAAPPGVPGGPRSGVEVRLPPAPPTHWTAGLLASLPARTAVSGLAEPAPLPPSQLVRARAVRDRLGGHTLYHADELPPDGLTLGSVEWELLRESVLGAQPLLRTIDREGRRGLAVAPPEGGLVEAVIGHIEARPAPGTHPLRDADGRILGWALRVVSPRPPGVVLSTRRALWRGIDSTTGRHCYGWRDAVERAAGVRVVGPCVQMELAPDDPASWVPVHALVRLDGRPTRAVVATSGEGPHGPAEERPLGYLRPLDDPGAGAVVLLRRAEVNGDLLLTIHPGEGDEVGFVTVAELGREPALS